MKHLYTLLIALIAGTASIAATTAQADSAFLADDFPKALTLYQQVVADEGPSSDIYYNIGNTYYRMGQNGRAIANYERALRIDPTNSDARANLEFVNARIVDKPSGKGSVFTKIIDTLCSWFTPNTWAWIGLVLFIIALAGTALYIFAGSVALRKIGFFGGIVVLVLSIFTIVIAWIGTSRMSADNEAIIVVEASQLSTQPRLPRDGSEEAALLHEGTKVEILDSLPSPADANTPMWYDVQ
ncbi:MAG: tetratricopeptide repeat protein, partial [Muribaculaceae bacterium]|nr:tetratricopeptide repeat protein [Muribaculaceae bacterium]